MVDIELVKHIQRRAVRLVKGWKMMCVRELGLLRLEKKRPLLYNYMKGGGSEDWSVYLT